MRILIAGESYYPGSNGQAVFTIHLAEGLAAAGNEVLALVPYDHSSPKVERLNGVLVHRRATADFSRFKPEMYVTSPWDPGIERIVREFNPQVIHIQDHYPLSRNALRVAHHLGIPIMGTNHFLPENLMPFVPRFLPLRRAQVIRFLWWTMLSVYRRLDTITTPTETAAAILRQQPLQVPVQAISCGVDTHHFCPRVGLDRAAIRIRFGLDPTRPLFLYVGRLEGEKRLDILLRALALQKNPEARLAIGGKGSQAHALAALARRLGIAERVTFTGYISPEDLPLLLGAADIFCMPSPEELQSIATLEAMSSAKPVLAANARALPELIANGVNGMLFRTNDVQDAARAMQQLLENAPVWERMGEAGLARSRAHSLENTIRRYEEVYRTLIHEPQPAEEESVALR
ncbi:MAG TPA: glycosyltransferase [Anaerolineaceae bacterium]|jgi:glycosyltransferase involved in cell wall biosynthesis